MPSFLPDLHQLVSLRASASTSGQSTLLTLCTTVARRLLQPNLVENLPFSGTLLGERSALLNCSERLDLSSAPVGLPRAAAVTVGGQLHAATCRPVNAQVFTTFLQL